MNRMMGIRSRFDVAEGVAKEGNPGRLSNGKFVDGMNDKIWKLEGKRKQMTE